MQIYAIISIPATDFAACALCRRHDMYGRRLIGDLSEQCNSCRENVLSICNATSIVLLFFSFFSVFFSFFLFLLRFPCPVSLAFVYSPRGLSRVAPSARLPRGCLVSAVLAAARGAPGAWRHFRWRGGCGAFVAVFRRVKRSMNKILQKSFKKVAEKFGCYWGKA